MIKTNNTHAPFQSTSPKSFENCPTEILTWTQQDYDILSALSGRVRLITLTQAASIWWPDGSTLIARRKLRRLCDRGLVDATHINAEVLSHTKKPILTWRPGNPTGRFDDISNKARSRWTHVATPHEVYFATRRCANLFGCSNAGLPTAIQWDHDLMLAQTYLHYRARHPEQARQWIGEDLLPKAGYRQKDPDAFLVNDAGYPIKVIESAGRYSPAQVKSFHEYCVEYDLPYELW